MLHGAPSIDDYDVVVARRNGRFCARIDALGLSSEGDSAAAAIASVTQMGEEFLTAAKSAGLIDDLQASASAATQAASAQRRARMPGISGSIMTAPPSDSYRRFFVKSLIAAGIFVVTFCVAALAGGYVFGNIVASKITDAVDSRIAQLSDRGRDFTSTGFIDAMSRATAYLQRVPPERKIELENDLRFIASELAPYVYAVVEPLAAPSNPYQPASNPRPEKPPTAH